MPRLSWVLALLVALLVPARAAERAQAPSVARISAPVAAAAAGARAPSAPASDGLLQPPVSTLPQAYAGPAAAESAASAEPAASAPSATAETMGERGPARRVRAITAAALPGDHWRNVSAQAADGAALFDGAARSGKALLLGTAAAALPSLAGPAALLPAAMDASYAVAGVASVAMPLPEAYTAFQRGHARDFPFFRAAIGALGTLALGLVNGVMLDKPLWGVMQTFIGLGIFAPFLIGLWLEHRGGGARAYEPEPGLRGVVALRHRLRRDRALRGTLVAGAALLAVSAALWGAAFAFVPAWLTAQLGAAGVANLLLAIQIGKALLFVAVFVPDVLAQARGQEVRGFSIGFTAVFFVSVAAYTIWGFSSALLTDPGPLREQYLVHGMRNMIEAVASGLSLFALIRARRAGLNPPKP